jgi:hypothetical protein
MNPISVFLSQLSCIRTLYCRTLAFERSRVLWLPPAQWSHWTISWAGNTLGSTLRASWCFRAATHTPLATAPALRAQDELLSRRWLGHAVTAVEGEVGRRDSRYTTEKERASKSRTVQVTLAWDCTLCVSSSLSRFQHRLKTREYLAEKTFSASSESLLR